MADTAEPVPEPSAVPVPPAVPGDSAPPAAKTVLKTAVAETDAAELVDLRRKLSETETARKQVELRAAELEDTVTRLRQPASNVQRSTLNVERSTKKRPAPLTAYEAFADDVGAD